MFASRVLSPIDPVFTTTGASARERAVDQQRFALECERWLDHWYRGSAQRARLKASLLARFGSTADPRGSDPLSNFDDDPAINDDGREIMAGTTELATVGYCRALAESLGVLYDSDDFERSYRSPDGALDEDASRVLEWYHSPSRGGLLAQLHLVDAWLPGLRTVGLLVEWEPDLEEISYQVLPPHWYTWWARPDRPCEPRLAYACAYSEAEAQDENGRPAPCPTWTCYVRPALPGDPADAPTRTPGFEDTGRLVRYRRPGHDLDQAPWPIPAPGDKSILPDPSMDGGVADGPNPLVIAGGMDDGRRVWCPIILHHSEPLVGGLRLPVADDQAQLGEELDIGLTSALHTGNTQSHGVLVITGPGDIPDRIGPSNPIHLVEGSASYIAPPGLARDHLDLLRRIAGLAGTFEHLPPDHYSDQPPSIETGPAKQLRRSELISLRSRRTVDAERPEAQRFDLERVLHNAYGVTPARPAIAWDTEQVVHWGELATPVDWSQRLQQMAQELAMGLSSTTDLLMERHGVSREEAERRVIDRAETEQRDRTSKPAAPDAPTGDQQAPTPDKGQPVDEEINA
jgi:hypothetical protein